MNQLINILTSLLILLLFLLGCQKEKLYTSSDVIVIVNSNSAEKSKNTEKIVLYLDHFGIKYRTIDLAGGEVPPDPGSYSLVIISHPEINGGDDDLASKMENFLEKCRSLETGILSFDPFMPDWLLAQDSNDYEEDQDVGALTFTEEDHYITGYHKPGEQKELFGYISIPKLILKEGEILLTGNNNPLLVVLDKGAGKVVQWTSHDWMYYSVLGPLGGLDDCLWKSIVWAARKPFIMQAFPPLVTMRVDDVTGCDRQQWDETPFHWVKTANKYGFKPWLGLFIYNITPEGIEELKDLVDKGLATASPHALGRPPQLDSSQRFMPDFYYPKAIPYLSKPYFDEFIFYDHTGKKPWPDETAKKILKAVDDWYSEIGPLPMSKYLIPHWGEIGSNVIAHVKDKWNIEFVLIFALDKSSYRPRYLKKLNSIGRGPFYFYDEAIGRPKEDAYFSRAFNKYAAEFVELEGKSFFNFIYAIDELTGYEWRPDNNVEATAARGIETLSRGLEGKTPAVLFTHETDHISKIEPENWDKIFSKISDGIAGYEPVYLTIDEALKIVRSFHTSEIESGDYNESSGELTVNMSGKTDSPTSIFVYVQNNGKVIEKQIDIPAFENKLTKVIQLPKN